MDTEDIRDDLEKEGVEFVGGAPVKPDGDDADTDSEDSELGDESITDNTSPDDDEQDINELDIPDHADETI